MGTWGKVPVLEHNGKVKGESLDLLEYLDQEFGGPTIMPTVKLLYLLPMSPKIVFQEFLLFFSWKPASMNVMIKLDPCLGICERLMKGCKIFFFIGVVTFGSS
jgi:hypothetical protein